MTICVPAPAGEFRSITEAPSIVDPDALEILMRDDLHPAALDPAALDPNERLRIAALTSYGILDTPPEDEYDDITRLASYLCQTPIALISLLDTERQWFKARVGMDPAEICRDVAFCSHALSHPSVLVVPDVSLDPRFAGNPLVTGEDHIRFYAGAPLRTSEGFVLGTLCVLDRKPRILTPDQVSALGVLASQVVARLELRRHAAAQQKTHSLLRAIVEGTTDAVFLKDLHGRYQMINAAGARLLGREVAEIIGKDDTQLLPAAAAAQTQANDRQVLETGTSYTYEDTEVIAGISRTYLCTKDVCRDGLGKVIGIIGIARDITERKSSEERLRLLEAAVEHANDVVVITEAEPVSLPGPRIVYVNPAFTRHTGYDAGEVLGKTPRLLQGPGTNAATTTLIHKALKRWKPVHVEILNYRKDGSEFWVDLNIVPIANKDGWYTHWVSVQRDITARKAMDQQREMLLTEALERADQDPLTGLWNHRAFHRRLEEEADRTQRKGGSLAVVMLDLDNFKFFNDAYGHAAGDDVLRRVAETLSGACRSYDTLARFGGDEFALLLPLSWPADASGTEVDGQTDGQTMEGQKKDQKKDQAQIALSSIHARLAECLEGLEFLPPGHGCAVPLEVSFGAALFPQEAATRAEVLPLADERLFRTKGGRSENELMERPRRLMSSMAGYSMLDALVAAVDNKDRYTRRHSEDVLVYSLKIAQKLGLDAETQHTVQVAALLHDVGKIGVPDFILRKPGKLTDEEFEAVKQHPVMGAVIVGAVPGLEDTLDAVRHHHERWDGGGYPFGLREEETPLIARLMAVADAFSAMTTDRPYRKGMAPEKALGILEEGAGTQWDPACVEAFQQAFRADQSRSLPDGTHAA